jgi:hypothetical protein
LQTAAPASGRKNLMPYFKYLKIGQKIFLRALDPEPKEGRFDSLTVYLAARSRETLDLALPYRNPVEEQYPFAPGASFEILSDSLGLGVSLTCRFREMLDQNLVRMDVNHDLQVFQRKLFGRKDLKVGLRITRGQGNLRSFREQWQKNIRILEKNRDISQLPAFPRGTVNLSASGIRFSVKAPVEVADLFLLLLEIDGAPPPICTLAEVVWIGEEGKGDRVAVGMRFIDILESDQKRIDRFLKANGEPLLPRTWPFRPPSSGPSASNRPLPRSKASKD